MTKADIAVSQRASASASGPETLGVGSNRAGIEAAVARFQEDTDLIFAEVGRRLVGHAPIVDGVLTALLAGGHVLLEGVPGLGKTLLVRTLGDALDLSFSRVQFTPDLMPSDVVGTNMIVESGGDRRFEFQRGPIFAHLVLADEINRATPKTQSALLEAMQEQSVTVGKTTYPLEPPFFVLATQNPIEMEGTYPLPEAQLDRFFFKLRVDLPAHDELHAILDRTTGSHDPAVRAVLARDRILEMRDLVRQVPVARPIQDYAVRIIEATHPDRTSSAEVKKFVRYGSSPRGAQAVILGAKIRAVRQGRFAPSFDDIRAVVPQALRHRVLLNFEGEAEGISTDRILAAVVGGLLEET
jgi:MoxR-like ATPase